MLFLAQSRRGAQKMKTYNHHSKENASHILGKITSPLTGEQVACVDTDELTEMIAARTGVNYVTVQMVLSAEDEILQEAGLICGPFGSYEA